jgi:hypothetical protein
MNDSTADSSSGVKPQQYQQPLSCLLCYSVETTMMDLFTVPSDLEHKVDVFANTTSAASCINNNNCYSGTNHCLVESKEDDDEDNDLFFPSPIPEATTDIEWSHDASSLARKVCKLWRRRRRQEKEKARRLLRQQQQAEPVVSVMPLSSSSSPAKTITKTVSFKMIHPNNKPYDEVEDDLQHPLKKKNNAIIVGKGKKTLHRVWSHRGMNQPK